MRRPPPAALNCRAGGRGTLPPEPALRPGTRCGATHSPHALETKAQTVPVDLRLGPAGWGVGRGRWGGGGGGSGVQVAWATIAARQSPAASLHPRSAAAGAPGGRPRQWTACSTHLAVCALATQRSLAPRALQGAGRGRVGCCAPPPAAATDHATVAHAPAAGGAPLPQKPRLHPRWRVKLRSGAADQCLEYQPTPAAKGFAPGRRPPTRLQFRGECRGPGVHLAARARHTQAPSERRVDPCTVRWQSWPVDQAQVGSLPLSAFVLGCNPNLCSHARSALPAARGDRNERALDAWWGECPAQRADGQTDGTVRGTGSPVRDQQAGGAPASPGARQQAHHGPCGVRRG